MRQTRAEVIGADQDRVGAVCGPAIEVETVDPTPRFQRHVEHHQDVAGLDDAELASRRARLRGGRAGVRGCAASSGTALGLAGSAMSRTTMAPPPRLPT